MLINEGWERLARAFGHGSVLLGKCEHGCTGGCVVCGLAALKDVERLYSDIERGAVCPCTVTMNVAGFVCRVPDCGCFRAARGARAAAGREQPAPTLSIDGADADAEALSVVVRGVPHALVPVADAELLRRLRRTGALAHLRAFIDALGKD